MASLLATLDRLDVVHPAAVPRRAEPRTVRCGEMVEQVGHGVVCTIYAMELKTSGGRTGPLDEAKVGARIILSNLNLSNLNG